jgi:hypothetical protein
VADSAHCRYVVMLAQVTLTFMQSREVWDLGVRHWR